jgi:CheY-like chemotaxis protein
MSDVLRAFIVDDQTDMRLLLRMVLSRHDDIEVTGEAANGLDAVAAIDAGYFDYLVLDQQMPGMSGLDVAREVRRQRATCPRIILWSAYLDPELEAQARALGVDRCVAKTETMTMPSVMLELAA